MSEEVAQQQIPTWRPEAVIFDCDGLLVDTEPCWTVGEVELFRRRGMEFGDEEKALLIGRGVADANKILADLFGEQGNEDAIGEELFGLVREVIAAEAQAMPGAQRVVELVAHKMPVAVASNSPRALLNVSLDRGGFADVFGDRPVAGVQGAAGGVGAAPGTSGDIRGDGGLGSANAVSGAEQPTLTGGLTAGVSTAGDEIVEPKPAPEIYLTSCDRLGVTPDRALAFEDSGTGARAAKAAGVRCVGVPTFAGQDLGTEWAYSSLADPHLLAWVETW